MARRYITSVLIFLVFISLVTSQTPEVKEFTEGSELVIMCNSEAVELGGAFTQIRTAQLLHIGDTDDEVAFLQQRDGTSQAISRRASGFFGWIFTIPSEQELATQLSDLTDNTDLMNISISKRNAQCSDSGIYRCVIEYVGGNTETQDSQKEFNYTGVGDVSIQPISVIPAENEYIENTTLTIKCSASGPQNFEFRWHRKCPSVNGLITPLFVSWPDPSILQEHTKDLEFNSNGQPNDCNTYRHMQEFQYTVQLDDNGCEIRCQFGNIQNNAPEVVSSNVTILVASQEGNTGQTGGNTSSASGDSLAIGLGVGLSLLVVIIIVILVYVFFCRNRNKDKKYKDEGQDNPDANNLGSNAPPPVFYSKPNKPPKSEKNDLPVDGMTNVALDTSYDSKDSANRPPPHYANAPDEHGPPHYNNEDNEPSRRHPSRRHPSYEDGRENRGYSDSPDPTADGGRKYRRRDRSNRGGSHNSSRDYDDEPRSVDYNPQPHYNPPPRSDDYDAEPRSYNPRRQHYTVELDNDYGDPSLGTAI